MKFKILSLLATLLLLTTYHAHADLVSEPPPPEFVTQLKATAQKSYDSTYTLYYLKDARIGSAWVVKTIGFRGTVLITQAHCVLNEKTGTPRSNTWWIGHSSWDPEKRLLFSLLAYNSAKEKDVAILFSTEHYELNEIEICAQAPRFSDPLIIMGNSPLLPPNTVLLGNFLSRVTIPGEKRDCYLTTNFTRAGCSGAPVLSLEGYVIGMVRGILFFSLNSFWTGQVTPQDYIIELLERSGIKPSLHTPTAHTFSNPAARELNNLFYSPLLRP